MKDSLAEYYFHQGTNYNAYDLMGVHKTQKGYVFRVWAPNAESVYLCGSFNGWDSSMEMKRATDSGIYEYLDTKQQIKEGDIYKYKIKNKGTELMKSDPYARKCEPPPYNASYVYTQNAYSWSDQKWMSSGKERKENVYSLPMNIYELHFGSWKRDDNGSPLNYKSAANEIASYLKRMGYTHVELLPIMAHPYEASWGYQITSYYSPDPRFGTPDDFKFFVDTMHRAGIGVILDWVPAHFPKDEQGLYEFDGQPLYEYQGKDRIEHSVWGTRRFDVGRNEVQSFLISNAIYWIKEYHADGLRVDAVASMLYLDYDRLPGEWIPNVYGDNRCLEAIEFFKKLTDSVREHVPHALLIAEESTAWANITTRENNGLGFDFKWNMGWMNDTLNYMQKDPIYRKYHHNQMTFSLTYSFDEKYILPISHDEVVHGKLSLLDKMSGDYWQKFANCRVYMAYMMTHPGKKLTFMGCELAPFKEWDHSKPLEWFMLEYEYHSEYQLYISELNDLYLRNPELWECDISWEGFEWIDADDAEKSIYSYKRKAFGKGELVVILNFTPIVREGYFIELDAESEYTEIFNTDLKKYGGSGVCNEKIEMYRNELGKRGGKLTLPPLGGIILRKEK